MFALAAPRLGPARAFGKRRGGLSFANPLVRAVLIAQCPACASESLQERELMKKISRYLWCALALSSVFLMCECNDASAPDPVSNAYQVVTVSDLHFNPLYDPTLYPSLVANDPSQWDGIFKGSLLNSPSVAGTDTNYALMMLTLADMKRHMGASPVVIFTGDMLGHYIPQNFYCAYYHTPPTTPIPTCSASDPTAVAAMQQFIDKTFAFVAAEIRSYVGDAPVLYVPGNIDTYQTGALGPGTTFLTNNAAIVYNQLLNGKVDQQTFLSTFTSGGYYSAEPLGSQLLVIGLNSNSFVAGSPTSVESGPELGWLNSQLASAQAAGQKVWILMHVPPGANSQGMAKDTPGQLDESNVSMNWRADVQSTFLQTLAKYPRTIALILAGHTHMDEYRILPSGNVLEQLPGISPCFGNNPAYKVLMISKDTLAPTDYESFAYDPSITAAQFESLYKFSTAYGIQGPVTFNYSLQQLYSQFLTNETQRNNYSYYFASGATGTYPHTPVPRNPITPTNWPVFSCTIEQLDQGNYIACVNTY
jgi:sphingomyelin phosphodiesterase acid-like 3